jgi:hypothetical protein
MKTFLVFLSFLPFLAFSSADDMVTIAISDIVNDVFIKESKKFDFFVLGRNTRALLDIANDVMKTTKTPLMVMKLQGNEGTIEFENSAILLYDSLRTFNVFYQRLRLRLRVPSKFSFFVYIEGLDTVEDIQKPGIKQYIMPFRHQNIP